MARIHWCTAAAALLLVGCSGGPEGEYSDASGAMTYKFKQGGKLEITMNVLGMVQTVETEYRYEEGKVKIGPSGGPQQVISVDKDGCLLAGFFAGKLCKK
jgi:PBP1b-binding outer membrane lipoprotein LpoB